MNPIKRFYAGLKRGLSKIEDAFFEYFIEGEENYIRTRELMKKHVEETEIIQAENIVLVSTPTKYITELHKIMMRNSGTSLERKS